MRNFRLLLTFTSLTAIAASGLVACGDDDTNGGTTTPPGVDSGGTNTSSSGSTTSSSGNTSSSGGTDSGPAKPTAAITATSVYLGQTLSLDGSGSTGSGLTYSWTVTPPAGSAITSGSIQNASSAKASFVPDKLGDYAITLTVKSGSDTATANVTLKAVDAPVFFFAQDANPSDNKNDRGTVRVSNVFGGDGDGGTEVACFEQDAGQSDNANSMSSKTGYGGELWSDWWEAPPGQPSRAVFYWRTEEGGKHAGRLFGVTSAGSCATPPTSIDVVANVENIDIAFELPRFSPNGQRVLYTKQDAPNHVRIASMGFDGTGGHSIADRQVFSDGGTDPDAGRYGGPGASLGSPGPRPVWIDDTNVAWITKDDNSNWQIVKAADADNATPTVLMTCTGNVPTDLAVLASGEILVAQRIADADANATATNIVGYTPDGTKKCGTARNITKMVSSGGNSYARGFTLSPDKTKLAYIAYDDGNDGVHAAVVPVDGSSAPIYLGNAASFTAAPRWIAGGTQLTWGVGANAIDGGGNTTTNVIAASPIDSDAGGHAIVKQSADRTYTAMSTSTCSIGYGFGSAMSGFGFLGLLGLGVTRRRRKK